MTYRTFDIDNNETAGATALVSTLEAVSRSRSRRRASLMSRRSTGCHLRGFGI